MNKHNGHILVVDDDDRIRNLVKEFLSQHGYLVTTSFSAEDAQKKITVIEFDLIVLDVMMQGKSGLEFILINKKKIRTPIILLTARGEPEDRIKGFETGADDYLSKPFEPKELLLRIQSILNRTQVVDKKRILEFESVKIDLNKLFITNKNKQYKINTTEKIILEKMINSPGITLSRETIGSLIKIDKERSIDVIITRLRKKIETNPKNPKYLQTIRGQGYVLWIE